LIVILFNLDMNVGSLVGLIRTVSIIYLKFGEMCSLKLHCHEFIFVNSF